MARRLYHSHSLCPFHKRKEINKTKTKKWLEEEIDGEEKVKWDARMLLFMSAYHGRHFYISRVRLWAMGDTKNWMIFTDEIIQNGQPARTSRHVCHFRFRRMSECYTSCDYDDDNSTNTNYDRVQWYYCTLLPTAN